MGTTLTGTTPQDTYDSLIKVTDNGPLSATAKRLSDGLGNDSALALSTSRVGINQSNPTVARLEIVESTNAEALRVDGSGSGFAFVVNGGTSYKSAIRNASVGSSYFSTAAPANGLIVEGNVGIGTSSPALGKLVVKDSGFQYIAETSDTATYGYLGVGHFANGAFIGTTAGSNTVSDILRFGTSGTERMRITSAGSVQIGSATGSDPRFFVYDNDSTDAAIVVRQDGVAPIQIWQKSGGGELMRVTQDGLTFNGDTAAANALDDYEEGDWTPVITFGGGSTGITYASRSGKYTKIGRQVSVTGYILLTSKGSSTGSASIEGLPFAVGNAVGFYSAATLGALSSVTFSGVPSGYGAVGGSKVELVDTLTTGTQLGISNTNFTNSSQILLQFTYFV